MANTRNEEFVNQELKNQTLSNLDVQNYWKHDYKLLRKAPIILCAKAFEISSNNLKNSISSAEAATLLFMCRLRSYIGLAIAEIIIEDYKEKVKKNPTMYIIELSESKTFFDTYILRDYLELALNATTTKDDCIKQLKNVFKPIFEREKKRLINYEEPF